MSWKQSRSWGACACTLAIWVIAPAQAQPAAPAAPPVARVWTVGTGGGSFLGVGIKEVDSERAKALKMREEGGVEVTRVEEDSPAAKAGLKPGDVVLQYNGQQVEGMEQFSRLVRETPPGREVKLMVNRDGSPVTLTAKVAARKAMAPMIQTLELPRVEIPPMPDIPRAVMSWRSPVLGIEAEPLRGQLADFFGVKQGVLVRSVLKDSAAEKAGIKAGDVIVKVNDDRVTSPSEITGALRSAEGKKSAAISLMREHKEMTVTATLDTDESEWEQRAPRPARVRAIRM